MNSSENGSPPATDEGRCPLCGSLPAPIVYGYPTDDMFEAAERGEVLLGGCVVFDGQPTSRCTGCGAAVRSRAHE